jgi:hypothetical protein
MHPFTGLDPVMVILAYIFVVIFGVVLNFIAAKLAEYFGTMVFLDAAGTATAAFTCGPVIGAIVGALTNLATGTLLYPRHLRFIYVNILCGILWGFLSQRFLVTTSETGIILFILAAGCIVGVASSILSMPLRCYLDFKTDHLLDKIDRHILGTITPVPTLAYVKIFLTELLLSHLLDKLICTMIGVMVALEITSLVELLQGNAHDLPGFVPLYHDLVEFFAAYYYVALAIVVKALHVDVAAAPGVSTSQQQLFALLGPLGLFSMLLGFPILLRVVGVILVSLAGVP